MTGNCPECKEAIRIPEGGSDLTVRCPLCGAVFQLETVLENLPPMLEIVAETGDLGIQIASGPELELVKGDGEASAESTASRRSYQPQKRKPVNPLTEILKVILGGALAIPIGVLCVWWFAGKAPFGFSEKVSEYVPWIVPEKLRGGGRSSGSDEPEAVGGSGNGPGEQDEKGQKIDASRRRSNRLFNQRPSSPGGSSGFSPAIKDLPEKGGLGQLPGDPKPNEPLKAAPGFNENRSKGDASEGPSGKKTDGDVQEFPGKNRGEKNPVEKNVSAKGSLDKPGADLEIRQKEGGEKK